MTFFSLCSSPQKAGSKGQKGSTSKKPAKATEAKASQESDAPGPVDEWIADGTAELEQQGVDPQFAVSTSTYCQYISVCIPQALLRQACAMATVTNTSSAAGACTMTEVVCTACYT